MFHCFRLPVIPNSIIDAILNADEPVPHEAEPVLLARFGRGVLDDVRGRFFSNLKYLSLALRNCAGAVCSGRTSDSSRPRFAFIAPTTDRAIRPNEASTTQICK
ncbi:hypothetical protein WR25_02855 [Diploscapter pachys]|uniref:Uncharacterized protein n=1 Tax=Diploscapter pachys TaxID=2018661 RepID=A0A2A2KPX9_9BILA|nr:hypothetical protein WR25_02855 [Diploscapter pachys]